MSKILNLEFYRLKRENDHLLDFIGQSVSDKEFFETNVHLIKCCIMEWHESNKKLDEMKGQKDENSSDVRSAQRAQQL